MKQKVVCFGELMLRLQPEMYLRFVQADRFEASFGGGEANVAVSLANYGLNSYYVSKLPAHAIGQMAVNSLRQYGVRVDYIARGGERIGIYYLEKGAAQRGSVCIYDRAHSAMAEAAATDFAWDEIFAGASWFHFTGITPALGNSVAEICLQACQKAHEHGLKVSCDLNYRGKLWSKAEAGRVLSQLCQEVDLCIANEEDAQDVFGIVAADSDVTQGKLNEAAYQSVAVQLAERFPFAQVAITLRESISAFDNNWRALLYDAKTGRCCFSKQYALHIVDRVGGGDSFGAGLIYALLAGKDQQTALEFAVAASALKHSVEGDYNMMTVKEVERLAAGNASGRVQR